MLWRARLGSGSPLLVETTLNGEGSPEGSPGWSFLTRDGVGASDDTAFSLPLRGVEYVLCEIGLGVESTSGRARGAGVVSPSGTVLGLGFLAGVSEKENAEDDTGAARFSLSPMG